MAMTVLRNPYRGRGLPPDRSLVDDGVLRDPAPAQAMLRHCPAAAVTPLVEPAPLAAELGVGALWLKDERDRMGLGSFKALGAAYAMARAAAERIAWTGGDDDDAMARALAGETFACASAGNHGLSLAAGARAFGARAVVYLSEATPEAFAQRLRRDGAEVRRAGSDWSASLRSAVRDAEANGWILLSDSSWPGYSEWPRRVMEGYLVAADEVGAQVPRAPTHVLLQAGVGGFAAAMAALFRDRWGDGPRIVVVEPDSAATLLESVRAGRPTRVRGAASVMGRLDCKEPSHLALAELARAADVFVTLPDDASLETAALLERHELPTTPSGAAGVGALHHAGAHRAALGFGPDSRVLAFLSEGPEQRA